jgi:PIN like domain
LDDRVWLALAGKAGWLVLMKDEVHKRTANLEALISARVRCFCLTNRGLTHEQQFAYFDTSINRIIQRGRKPGPFVYGIYVDHITRLWPGDLSKLTQATEAERVASAHRQSSMARRRG